MVRKVAVPVDEGREARWALRPEFEEVEIHGRSDAEILIRIRSILSGGAAPSAPISRSEAAKVAEFIAHALPDNFALSRRQILQLLTLASFLDGTASDDKFSLVELRNGLEILGQDEVVRLLRAANSDGRAMEQLKLRLGDVKGL